MWDHPTAPKKFAEYLIRQERRKSQDLEAVGFHFSHREYFPPFLMLKKTKNIQEKFSLLLYCHEYKFFPLAFQTGTSSSLKYFLNGKVPMHATRKLSYSLIKSKS